MLGWLAQHGSDLLQSTSVVSLLLAAYTIHKETRERRIGNLFTITGAHRELWKTLYEKPELRSVLADSSKGEDLAPTFEEQLFVHLLILHLAAAFRARSYGMYFQEHGLAADIQRFFSRPIPRAVWKQSQQFQEPDFVEFVEGVMGGTASEPSGVEGKRSPSKV